jgi:Tfp pilus assembly protein FimT
MTRSSSQPERLTVARCDNGRSFSAVRLNLADRRLSHLRKDLALIDLTITVLIMDVVAATASPKFVVLLTSYTAESTARREVADLKYAASAAAQTSQSTTVTFDVSGNSCSVTGVDSPDHPGSA